uniref:NADH dehydrogenase subunit 4L n=1 Tax=Chordodes sp. VVA-2019 TaxID=2586751 RepID=A0A514ABW0_9BILA|nr:NADH dehydrogenase subunit 4L [Chordodes sp. VVA-2019]
MIMSLYLMSMLWILKNKFMYYLLMTEFLTLWILFLISCKYMIKGYSNLMYMTAIILLIIEATLALSIFMLIYNITNIFKSKIL